MKKLLQKLFLLIFSSFLVSTATLLTVYARLGTTSWDMLHLGILHHSPFSLGFVSQIVGIGALFLAILLKQYPGIATFLNILLIGIMIDMIDGLHVISSPKNLILQFFMLCMGIIILGFGTYFYTIVGWGAGPRDSLMLALTKALNQPVWIIRTTIECIVVVFAMLLGEKLRIGTFLIAFAIGPVIEMISRSFKRDLRDVKQKNIILQIHTIKQSIPLQIIRQDKKSA